MLVCAALISACGGKQPVETIWAMPAMQPNPGQNGYPFAYANQRGGQGDATEYEDEELPRGDLPETILNTAATYWESDEAAALRKARSSGKGLLIVFHAEWSEDCRALEADTLSDYEVRVAIRKSYVPLRIDVTEETVANREQLERYKVMRVPAIVLLDSSRREQSRIEQYVPPMHMLEHLGSEPATARK